MFVGIYVYNCGARQSLGTAFLFAKWVCPAGEPPRVAGKPSRLIVVTTPDDAELGEEDGRGYLEYSVGPTKRIRIDAAEVMAHAVCSRVGFAVVDVAFCP